MKQLMFYKTETLENVTILLVSEGTQPFPSVTKPIHRIATCVGWSLTPGGPAVEESTPINVTSNMSFFPVWEGLPNPGKWEITFKPNGAEGAAYSDYCDDGNMYTLPLTTTFIHPLGYTFAGWAASGSSTAKISSTFMDRDKTFYAIWKSPKEIGIGHATGNYIPIGGGLTNMSKMPITSNGVLPFLSWLSPHKDSEGTPDTITIYYNGVVEKTISGQSLIDYKIKSPNDTENYTISTSSMTTTFYMVKDVGVNRRLPVSSAVEVITGSGVLGKTFCGWATQPNIKENLNDKTGNLRKFGQIWPVYRKNIDAGQFIVTFDANDGTGRTLKIVNIDNEAVFVNDALIASLGINPPEGKVFAGFSETPFGTPIYHDYYIVARDCALYAIWVDA